MRLPTVPGRVVMSFAGLAAVGLITFVAFRLALNLTVVAFLHLMIVVLLARRCGFVAASVVATVAVVCQLYFFVPPVLSWRVADPGNLIALVTFEYCALVVSRLSNRALSQTELASRRQSELEALYRASRLVLLLDPRRDPGPQVVQLVQEVFACSSVAIFDARAISSSDPADESLNSRLRHAFIQGEDSFDERDAAWFRVLRMGTRAIGALALRGGPVSEPVANALASLVAIAIERTRSLENESRAEVARHAEHLRTAVLDAFAHDVKTPLTSIRTASSGLLEAGALDPLQLELVRLIDEECIHITALTDRILRMARLDAGDVHLRRGRVNLLALLRDAVTQALQRVPGRRMPIESSIGAPVVSGDAQLLTLALAQLIDNALKYSTPDTPISCQIRLRDDEMILSIHNFGAVIAPHDIESIFARFYRAAPAGKIAGTGLGLSITRKIVDAHSGRVWAASDAAAGTTFYLALPALPESVPAGVHSPIAL